MSTLVGAGGARNGLRPKGRQNKIGPIVPTEDSNEGQNYWERVAQRGASRRRVLQAMGAASIAAVAGSAFVACGDDDDSTGSNATSPAGSTAAVSAVVRGGELVVRRPSATTFADPHRSSSGYDPTVNHLYAAPLLRLSEGKLGPSLVTKWEQVDPTTVTLTLRPDLTFTDGTPVNAAAVKYAFERQSDPKLGAPRRAPSRASRSKRPMSTRRR